MGVGLGPYVTEHPAEKTHHLEGAGLQSSTASLLFDSSNLEFSCLRFR